MYSPQDLALNRGELVIFFLKWLKHIIAFISKILHALFALLFLEPSFLMTTGTLTFQVFCTLRHKLKAKYQAPLLLLCLFLCFSTSVVSNKCDTA